ncbi:small nuclear ribonucleoprotein (Sm) [Thermoproteus sp. CP80]|jgi:small nuclear ribonucleoprotein|uniref:LSM domain-containing protein n=1 Tax=Thermoproteus sp. CP80 TaxID=1650659 RepID=UPI0009BE94EB|nr:LSM domain-containing protein [Thermoproteus sp. CP80]PLC67123.1 small nuclear ribonucleoprotein (Sm) [Thermoproteus sp. CP80]
MSNKGQQLKLPSPLKVLSKMVNKVVVARLKGDVVVRGVLSIYDSCMNLVLDDAEELDKAGAAKMKYGRILIRGSQVIYISSEEAAA